MEESGGNQSCPSCRTVTSAMSFFCPNCGKKLREKPLSTSVLRQIGIYLFSILLPPLGLWHGITYLLQKDRKAKIIGGVAILLTLVSTVITIWLAAELMNTIYRRIEEQLNLYQTVEF